MDRVGEGGSSSPDADVFGDDASVDRVRSWHRCAPAARLKLVLTGQPTDPDVLIRAIRAGDFRVGFAKP